MPGKSTRGEALAAMEGALERNEITFREFTVGEDQLNKGLETPSTILKSLQTRRKEPDGQDERLEKAEKKPTIQVSEKRAIPLSIRLSPRLSGEAEILIQNDEVESWVGKMIANSFTKRKFL
jgi:hypothetical protein